MKKKVALVIPWYGHATGGAEMAAQELAEQSVLRGFEIEVLTTCCRSPYDNWGENNLPAGTEKINGVTVHRFPVAQRNEDIYHAINYKFIHNLPVSRDECTQYMENNINSHDMMEFIKKNNGKYWFIFTPFPFGTTYWGHSISPENSFLMPHLHNEPLAHTENIREMFERSRGIFFNTEADMALAASLFQLSEKQKVLMGLGVLTDKPGLGQRFRDKYSIDKPFMLYVGKKQVAKNVALLIDYFYEYKKWNKNDLQLVLIGPDHLPIPTEAKAYIIDLGTLPEQDRNDAYSAANIFCQPSCNESFSRVLMEAWLYETPALVNEECAVTKYHCLRGNGGLYFNNQKTFEACLNFYLSNPKKTAIIGKQGQEYVLKEYSFDTIVPRYKNFFASLED